MSDYPICSYCREPIVPPEAPVLMAKQIEVTAMTTGRQWSDGLQSAFHEHHAPVERVGAWRRVV
jgi:hypothetical protein